MTAPEIGRATGQATGLEIVRGPVIAQEIAVIAAARGIGPVVAIGQVLVIAPRAGAIVPRVEAIVPRLEAIARRPQIVAAPVRANGPPTSTVVAAEAIAAVP
jgi:hypothetical protein